MYTDQWYVSMKLRMNVIPFSIVRLSTLLQLNFKIEVLRNYDFNNYRPLLGLLCFPSMRTNVLEAQKQKLRNLLIISIYNCYDFFARCFCLLFLASSSIRAIQFLKESYQTDEINLLLSSKFRLRCPDSFVLVSKNGVLITKRRRKRRRNL